MKELVQPSEYRRCDKSNLQDAKCLVSRRSGGAVGCSGRGGYVISIHDCKWQFEWSQIIVNKYIDLFSKAAFLPACPIRIRNFVRRSAERLSFHCARMERARRHAQHCDYSGHLPPTSVVR